MLTPAISVEIGSSRTVVSRAQPPGSIRMWLSANDQRRLGRAPWSVLGGLVRLGFSAWRPSLRGPMMSAPSGPRIGSGAAWAARAAIPSAAPHPGELH